MKNQIYVTRKKANLTFILYCAIAFVIASFLSSLPHYLFKDRESYINDYALGYNNTLESASSWISFIFNEPLFLYLNKWLSFFNDPLLVVSIIVFSVSFFTLVGVFKLSNNIVKGFIFYLLIYCNVQFFAIQLVTLRQGLGFAIFFLSLSYIKEFRKLSYVCLLLGLIHNSFFVLFFFLFVYDFLVRHYSFKNSIFILGFIGLFFNSILLVLTKFVGSKQSYEDYNDTSSGVLFIFWLLCFIYILLFKVHLFRSKGLLEKNILGIALVGLIIYLTSYFLSPIAGRIIGTFIPFIFYVLLCQMNLRDYVFVFLFVVLNLFIMFNGGLEAFLVYPLEKTFYFLQKI